MELASLVTALFKESKGPVGLDELTSVVVQLQGIQEARAEQATGDDDQVEEEIVETLSDTRASAAIQLDQKVYLEKLWLEILELPERQRAALLLNLRDARGNSMVEMLPITGVASVRQIAEALSLTALEFARLWNDLPLDDNAIAARLRVNRQQVINLRKSARMRLARRMRDY